MEAAAGAAAALALRGLVDEDEVVAGGVVGPADLRVGAAEAVAEVVGQPEAEGVVVEVEVVEVAVVERRAEAQKGGLGIGAGAVAEEGEALLAHEVGAGEAAGEGGRQRLSRPGGRSQGYLHRVEDEPGGFAH